MFFIKLTPIVRKNDFFFWIKKNNFFRSKKYMFHEIFFIKFDPKKNKYMKIVIYMRYLDEKISPKTLENDNFYF